MNVVMVVPIVLPLLAAGLSMMLARHTAMQRALGVAVLAVTTSAAVVLLVHVDSQGPLTVDVGGWPAPVGITLVADRFAAVMLLVSQAMLLTVLVFAIGHPRTDDEGFVFHPIYLVLATGISAAFLTGDLFNLFVAFEVMLSASYVLITFGGRDEQVRPGMTYVVISLLASTLFVAAVGLVYAATGTVNFADLAVRLGDLPDEVRNALGLLLLVVFGVKAAIFPLFFWLPDSYPTAPTPVTAIFAGLLTKVGVYAIIRSETLLFPSDGPSPLILTIAGATMVVGVLGALAQDDVKRILSFHIVSQIGYMIMGIGLFSLAGLAATVYYVIHHIVVKTTLFLVGGLIELRAGTGALSRIHGLLHRAPLIAALFLLPALSLAGIPPFSGFVAKLGLVEAGTAAQRWTIVAVSLAVSLLTLLSMTKIWSGVFWGEPAIDPTESPDRIDDLGPPEPGTLLTGTRTRATEYVATRPSVTMLASTGVLVAAGIAIALAAGPIFGFAEDTAAELFDPAVYVEAVTGQ